MKRRQKLALTLLLLPSLFLSLTCGIPHFINLDSPVSISKTTPTEDSIGGRVRITERGMDKIAELDAEPALKFFYTFSANLGDNAPPSIQHNDAYKLSDIRTLFATNVKGSMGNGVLWSPESPNSAPGFFLYTKENNTIKNFARSSRAIVNRHPDEPGILVGTFSSSANNSVYHFGTAPGMDLLLPIETFGGSGTYEFNFTLEKVADSDGFLIKLDSNGDELFFKTYKKNLFPNGDSIDNLIKEDSFFYSDIVNYSQGRLYLHIWVSLYGGAGEFTNIYWSPLTYLGALELF